MLEVSNGFHFWYIITTAYGLPTGVEMRFSGYKVVVLCVLAIVMAACSPVPASSPSVDATDQPLSVPTMTPVPTATPRPAPTNTPIPTQTPRPTPAPPPTPSLAFLTMVPQMSLRHMDRVYPGFPGSSVWPVPTQRLGVFGWIQSDAIPANPSFTIS